jgi:hypothetical protein
MWIDPPGITSLPEASITIRLDIQRLADRRHCLAVDKYIRAV